MASFLVEKFGPKLGAYLFKTGKHKAGKEIGKKVKPVITGAITGGGAQAGTRWRTMGRWITCLYSPRSRGR